MKKVSIKNLNEKQKLELVEKVSRGRSQWYVIRELLEDGKSDIFCNYMKSQRYSGNYTDSYINAAERLQELILETIELVKGERGGYWSAYLVIK